MKKNELEKLGNSQILSHPPGCHPTATALEIEDSISEKEFMEVGEFLTNCQSSLGWWKGDFINFAKSHPRLTKIRGLRWILKGLYATWTQKYLGFVAQEIEPSRRRDALSFFQHQKVAGLPRAEQDDKLNKAMQEALIVNFLRGDIDLLRGEIYEFKKEEKTPSKKAFCYSSTTYECESHRLGEHLTVCTELMKQLQKKAEELLTLSTELYSKFPEASKREISEPEKDFREQYKIIRKSLKSLVKQLDAKKQKMRISFTNEEQEEVSDEVLDSLLRDLSVDDWKN